MVNASCVNTKVIAMVAQDNGKLKAAPSIVSVTDSFNASLSIFIKKLFQVYIYTCTRKGWQRGVVSNIATRKGAPVTCCIKGERDSQHLRLVILHRLAWLAWTVPKKERDPLFYPYLLFHPQLFFHERL